jgi:hypothetical protein
MTADLLRNLERDTAAAVAEFWRVNGTSQGVRGGKQMDGFVRLVYDLLVAAGLNNATIFHRTRTEVPGWFRAEKRWDLLVVAEAKLVAAIEFKSQAGSFGNNFNNRSEEAVGSATDLWAAFREGAMKPSAKPWLGFLMLLEDAPGSTQPVGNKRPHFEVFPEFRDASYARRYEVLLTKLVRERLYDAACLLLSPRNATPEGAYTEPAAELSVRACVTSLLGRAIAVAATQRPGPPTPPNVVTPED